MTALPRGRTPQRDIHRDIPRGRTARDRGDYYYPAPPARPRRRGAVLTALVAVISLGVTGYACVLAVQKQHARAADSVRVISGISSLVGSSAFGALANPSPVASPSATMPAAQPVALTATDRQDCPAAATACVNLTEKITWLQAGGKVSFGPVRMEPGPPGTPHATPSGTFHVSWKAGPHFVSNIYGDPMPWAVFFAPGGIAFHGGSLTESSHGCVHLTVPNARYYSAHLPIGAEVVVF